MEGAFETKESEEQRGRQRLKGMLLSLGMRTREAGESMDKVLEGTDLLIEFASKADDPRAFLMALELVDKATKAPLSWAHLRTQLIVLYDYLRIPKPEPATALPEEAIGEAEIQGSEEAEALSGPSVELVDEPLGKPPIPPESSRATPRKRAPVAAGKTDA